MRRLLTLALLLGIAFSTARADDRSDLEKRLRSEYRGKVVLLRTFYDGGNLRFDADGNNTQGGKPGPWTIDAEVRVEDLHIDKGKLQIEGRRLFLIYDQSRSMLADFGGLKSGRPVRITLELPPGELSEDSVRALWKKVFLGDDEKLADFVPYYWRDDLEHPAGSSVIPRRYFGAVTPVTPDMTPPKQLHTPDPAYSSWAKEAHIQGTLVLGLVINEQGEPRDIRIVRPLGLGLDDNAVAAVSRWKFKPALKDGKPVAVAINVEINFHLY